MRPFRARRADAVFVDVVVFDDGDGDPVAWLLLSSSSLFRHAVVIDSTKEIGKYH